MIIAAIQAYNPHDFDIPCEGKYQQNLAYHNL